MVRLSALVCVQNQDGQLSDCLRRLSFCDEIVVVADRCSDRSQEIARRHGATVVDGIFPLENQRKAAGLSACTGDWVLELEADEIVDAALAWEVRAVLQMRPRADAYEIPIDNYVGDALVRAGWLGQLSADRAIRLYRPSAKAWRALRRDDGRALHGSAMGALKGAIRRRLGPDLGALFERMDRLTALTAEDLADCGVARPQGGILFAAAQFARSYVVRGGWREGRLGLLVGVLNAVYPIAARLRAREVMAARGAAAAARPGRLRQVVGLAR